MASEIEFDCLIGTTIKYCQCIENDIKLIYSGMLEGNFDENFNNVRKNTLGTVISKLQTLDNSDDNPYFSASDYKLFREITQIRNYWAHQGYLDYVYDTSNFSNQYNKLYNENKRLEKLHRTTQDIRLEFFGYSTGK